MNQTSRKLVGFVIDGFPFPYNYANASIRLRVYDVIRSFRNNPEFTLELYRPWKKYDLVFFQKRDRTALSLAEKIKRFGTKIVFDVNANIFNKQLYGKGFFKKLSPEHFENAVRFAFLSDYITVTSPYLESSVKKLFHEEKVIFLPENIADIFFKKRKEFPQKIRETRLLYAGYSAKATQVYLIERQLKRIASEYPIRYIFICERNPRIFMPNIQCEYVKFNYKNIHEKLLLGDIFLAPRDLNDEYNLAHSFTKIGLPMSIGIPVVASPLPSYKDSPAILIDSFGEDWYKQMKRLITEKSFYAEQSAAGIRYCRENFSVAATHEKYLEFFRRAL